MGDAGNSAASRVWEGAHIPPNESRGLVSLWSLFALSDNYASFPSSMFGSLLSSQWVAEGTVPRFFIATLSLFEISIMGSDGVRGIAPIIFFFVSEDFNMESAFIRIILLIKALIIASAVGLFFSLLWNVKLVA